MADKSDLHPEVVRRIKAGQSVRKVAEDLGLSRKEVGEQTAQIKETSVWRWMIIVLTITMIMVGIFNLIPDKTRPRSSAIIPQIADSSMPAWLMNFRAIGNQVRAVTPDDNWLVTDSREAFVPVMLALLVDLGKRITDQIEFGLERNSSIPAVAKLRQIFGRKLRVTYFQNGATIALSAGADMRVPGGPDTQEVTLFDKSAQGHPGVQGQMLFFSIRLESLMIGAIEWDPVWLEATSLHELYHAMKFREGAVSATAPSESDSYVEEEVEAHDLEYDVLNLRTQGKFGDTVRKIIDRKDADTREDVVRRIGLDDMVALDHLFLPAGIRQTEIRQAQYWLSLMNESLLRKKLGKEELKKEKLANYRLLVSTAR